eukprot:TRINITY_DN2542_c0_g1_i2.p1 TRINITY_DN2542_c0_g1~~TRINITY_DN2542_c0_g1_i2.p1  ORF type:complete len:277 (-),score=27.60 TRINITY_DN2542_c0_g1_i2:191-1021(-)
MLYSQQRPGTRPFIYKRAEKKFCSGDNRVLWGVGAICALVLILLVVNSGAGPGGMASLVGGDTAGLLCDRPVDMSNVEVVSWDPRAFVYHGFLTDEECDYVVQKALDTGLKRSEVAAAKSSESVNNVRTSYGAFLSSDGDPVMRRIEDRIAAWSHIPAENGEQFYFLRYQDGQQYKPHHDYFHEELPGMDKYIGSSGQRTATVLLYLHTPEEGGETIFPHTGKTVEARKGDALLFFSHHPDWSLDPNSLHGGLPVIRGTKYSATKWMRLNQYRVRE